MKTSALTVQGGKQESFPLEFGQDVNDANEIPILLMSFQIKFLKLTPPQYPDQSGGIFEVSLINGPGCRARIVNYAFELWHIVNRSTNGGIYLSNLWPDLNKEFPDKFEPEQQYDIKLIWHFTHEMLQQIENDRNGENPALQMRAHLSMSAAWRGTGDTWQPPEIKWERPFSSGGSYPIFLDIASSEWSKFLAAVGFRHLSLERYSTVKMPPEFRVPEAHLLRGWDHHRNNRPEEALQFCFKAFECLGFNLYSDDQMKRSDLINKLLHGESQRKTGEVEKLLAAMSGFFHLGRHEQGVPAGVTHKDSELALMCASALMSYFAKCKP